MVVSEYYGCKFPELARCSIPVVATVSYGDERLVFKGELTIDRTEGSWKYGDELQIHLYCNDLPKFEKRVKNNGYSRIEIAIPFDEGKKMILDAYKILNPKLQDFM